MANASRCVASQEDGMRCPEPETTPDPERGGRVCWRYDLERWRGFCWTDEDEITITPAEGEEDA
jgi:hypothetical protein